MILLLLSGLQACQQQPADNRKPEADQRPAIILEIGDRQITREQFDQELSQMSPDMVRLPEAERQQFRQQLLRQIIDRELILFAAKQQQIQVTADELEVAMSSLRGGYDREEFAEVLRRHGQTAESLNNTLTLQLVTQKLIAQIIAPHIEVTEQEAADYYHQQPEQFRRPAEVRVHQMLFSTYDEAMTIRNRWHQGESFATLAAEYSLSPDRAQGGLLGYFAEGYLPPEFDSVIFNLPLRQISYPVESPYGFHLLMVDHIRAAGLLPFAAVKDEISASLYQNKEDRAFQQWLRQLREETPVKIAPELGADQPLKQ